MLIDFDGQVDERRAKFEQAIPEDLKAASVRGRLEARA